MVDSLRVAVLRSALPFFVPALTAQSVCSHLGSVPVAASWTASPVPLGCSGAPSWPAWHLFTPPHRAPVPHVGFDPGNAIALPRLLIEYRCTGFLLLPVVPARVRTMGYVIDRPEYACAVTS
jgi:hypothetical protein